MFSNRLSKLFERVKNRMFDPYFWYLSKQEFNHKLTNVGSLSEAIDIAWNFKGAGYYAGRKPNQDQHELITLARRVRSLSPSVIVEIGTRFGGTLLVWSQISNALELLVSIDLPGGIHGGGYPPERAKLYHLYRSAHPQFQLELLRLNSQDESTKSKVTQLLRGRPIDFLFIDGDHRYHGVKTDYELYSQLVRPGGIIAFHDIRPNPEISSIEVFKLWNEIKSSGQSTEEIIREPHRGKFGIGLLVKS